jgi:DNA-binding NarL/FixJ family response regulator
MPADKTSGKRKVLIVDDHAVFREGLVRILSQEPDLEVCGEAEDGVAALRLAADLKPNLSIVDLSLEGMSGLDLTKALHARFPALRILILSMHKEKLHAERALRAGAHGYIMKRESGRKLIAAIRHVLSGQTYVSEEFNEYLLGKLSHPQAAASDAPDVERLSDRELEIFRLIGQGYGTRQIADALHLSMKTVEFHRESIRAKFNLQSTFELVQQAIHWTHYEKDAP